MLQQSDFFFFLKQENPPGRVRSFDHLLIEISTNNSSFISIHQNRLKALPVNTFIS